MKWMAHFCEINEIILAWKQCAMLNQSLDLRSRAGLPFKLRFPCSSEDFLNWGLSDIYRVIVFDSIHPLTFSTKKTKRMMSWSLRKPNYKFWPGGTALMLSCCSLMTGWLQLTLWVTSVEADLRTHGYIEGFFVLVKNLCSTTEDISKEAIFPMNNSSSSL